MKSKSQKDLQNKKDEKRRRKLADLRGNVLNPPPRENNDNLALWDDTPRRQRYVLDEIVAVLEANKQPGELHIQINDDAVINEKNEDGQTLLHTVVIHNPDTEAIEALLEHGADIHVKDAKGWTLLHFAAQYNRSVEMLEFLLAQGLDINAHGGSENITPLYTAVNAGSFPIVKALLENGADPNRRVIRKTAPLHLVGSQGSDVEILKILVAHGADINAKNDEGLTPLHDAAFRNPNLDILKTLIALGADVNAKGNGKDGCYTPMDYAENDEKRAILRAAGGRFSDFDLAAMWGNADDVLFFIERGEKIHFKSVYAESPLHLAASHNSDVEVLKTMFAHGAKVNAKGICDHTPLHMAAMLNPSAGIIKFLIASGANVNAINTLGKTPLDYADTEEKQAILRAAGGEPGNPENNSRERE